MTLIRTLHDSSVDVTWQIDSTGVRFPWLILLFSIHACSINILQVDPPCDCSVPSNCVDKPLCNSAIDASNLLNINSYTNHDAYCLAYIFTYRDFEGGTLGLAWVAEPGSKWTMIMTLAFFRLKWVFAVGMFQCIFDQLWDWGQFKKHMLEMIGLCVCAHIWQSLRKVNVILLIKVLGIFWMFYLCTVRNFWFC